MNIPTTPAEMRAEAARQRRSAARTSSRARTGRGNFGDYQRLGVNPNDVLLGPKCTPFLEEIGGVHLAISALRASPLPEARAFMARYDDPTVSADMRRRLPVEAFCAAAHLCPSRLSEIAVGAIAKNKLLRGAVIAALNHPDIMETNVTMARTPDGIEDRMAHMKMVGAMPAAKGAQTVVNVSASASAQSLAAAKSDSAVPTAEDTVRRIVEARQQRALTANAQPALPAASPVLDEAFMPRTAREPVTIDADYDDTEE